MNRIIALLCVMAIALSVCACDKTAKKEKAVVDDKAVLQEVKEFNSYVENEEDKKIPLTTLAVGEWTAKIDITDNFNAFLQDYAYDFTDLVDKEKIDKHADKFKVGSCVFIAKFKFEGSKLTLTTSINESQAMREKLRPVWHAIMDEMLIALGMGGEGSSEQMFSGELGFDAFFTNVTSVIEKEMSGDFSFVGNTLVFDGTSFANADIKNSTAIMLDLTEDASAMFSSDTYYVIQLGKEWLLRK